MKNFHEYITEVRAIPDERQFAAILRGLDHAESTVDQLATGLESYPQFGEKLRQMQRDLMQMSGDLNNQLHKVGMRLTR